MQISEPFPLTVDRVRSLQQMIEAGHYDYADPEIIEHHVPVNGTGVVTAAALLVRFNRFISTETVLAELARLNLRPGDLIELLAFGAQYPEMQRKFSVLELASIWMNRDGYRNVATLSRTARERVLVVSYPGGGWRDIHRFLAFRKS